MFTGLIEKTGRLAAIKRSRDDFRMELSFDSWPEPVGNGESISVSGVCLTVVQAGGTGCSFDLLEETLQRTSLGRKKPGDMLNLERALKLDDRVGGHLVSGHVDGAGAVRSIRFSGRDRVLDIECGNELASQMALKGSVACDGVSLTITDTTDDSFTVHIIPYTWEHTAFAALKEGDVVNIETDLIGKFVRKHLQAGAESSLTFDKLRNAGFA